MIRAWLTTNALYLALAALLGMSAFSGVQTLRLANAHRDLAQRDATIAAARETAAHDARLKEAQLANAASNADAQYAKGMTDAQSAADALAAALHAGSVQLRGPWRCEEKAAPVDRVPAHATAERRINDGTDDRQASASRIVRAADTCDAQVTALQAYIRAALRIVNGEAAK